MKTVIGAKGLGGAAALVGAVGAGSLTLFGGNEPQADAPEPVIAEETAPRLATPSADFTVDLDTDICLPGVLRASGGCASMKELRSGGQAMLSDSALPRQPLTLVHPTDMDAEPREVDGCDSYRALKREDWSGLSSADMRREARFYRSCGLLEILKDARPMPAAGRPDRPEITSLDLATLPRYGESGFSEGDAVSRESENPAVWSITGTGLVCTLSHVGTADFDGDGEAEHLMEWTIAAREGTYRQTGFGYLERAGRGGMTFRTTDPFAG